MPVMALIGIVSKTNNGTLPFVGTLADGTYLGNFVSVRAAQLPIEGTYGQMLRWRREVNITGVEVYLGENT